MSSELLGLAIEVAREAATLVRDRRAAGVTVAATKSSIVDVVTEADQASEALIRDRLLAARPGDGFLGEEGSNDAGESGVRWVVDPIDGTVNYLYGLPQYAVSIAAQVDGRSVAGVVLNAATGTTYTATAGGGAFRDGTPLRVRPVPPLEESLFLTGFSYSPDTRRVQAEALARMLPRVRDIRRLGSCALDLCHVAEGLVDGYVEEGVAEWDHAAASLIAVEAGATFELTTGSHGRPAIVCSPADGFDRFRALVAECGFLATEVTPSGE